MPATTSRSSARRDLRRLASEPAVKRVVVIGCPGAGKSTFAARLANRTGLPLISLDAAFWQPGWVPCQRDRWRETVVELSARESWIMDGNYSSTLDLRLPRADSLIWFRLPRWRCLTRVILRSTSTYGKVRPEMAAGCPERFDLDFFRFVWSFDRNEVPGNYAAIRSFGSHLRPVIIRRDAEAEAFLDSASDCKDR